MLSNKYFFVVNLTDFLVKPMELSSESSEAQLSTPVQLAQKHNIIKHVTCLHMRYKYQNSPLNRM